MFEIVETTEGTDMMLLAYLNTQEVSHFKYLFAESWQSIWASPVSEQITPRWLMGGTEHGNDPHN